MGKNLLPTQNHEENNFLRRLKPKTENQAVYVQAIKNATITFCCGIAGTGKTYIAVGMAVRMLMEGSIKRIIISRPIVECGEKLGALPGVMKEKVDPFMRPIVDALIDFLGPKEIKQYLDNDIIEICPLAYMRGRTLNDSVVILDEAQNAKYSQIEMFLTRLGFNSKMIVTGDLTQTDLEKKDAGGLEKTVNRLNGVDERIKIVRLYEEDVQRNELIPIIIGSLRQNGNGSH